MLTGRGTGDRYHNAGFLVNRKTSDFKSERNKIYIVNPVVCDYKSKNTMMIFLTIMKEILGGFPFTSL